MKRLILGALALAATAGPAAAEIVERRDDGFVLAFETEVPATAEAILGAVLRPTAWWSDAHTYSGAAANLSLDPRPGGCWCEALADGGGVKHGELVLLSPARGLARFEAPFGPLQALGADAVLTVTWGEQGDGRRLAWSFRASAPGAGALADPVHGVMQAQFDRLAAHLGGGPPAE